MDSNATLGGGRYVVRGVLGEGAQGTTFDAIDTRDQRPVAIKRFDVRGARSWKDVELAEREARVLATLDHPLVPRYIEHFEENGALYLVMQKIDGETLEAMRLRLGPIPEEEVRRFLACADRALTYLHGRSSPVVHRDLKPRNVVRRPDGSYVLVDFGAVTELMQRRGASTVVGTMGYMAPEQFQGRARPATDVYAVGATALAALTGAEPETLVHHGLRIDVRGALEDRASPALIASLERMLEPDPDARAPSLADALDGVRAEPAVSVPFPAAEHRGSRSERRAARREARTPRTPEDVAVKSIRSLLWVLWGLGWVLAPVVLKQFGDMRLLPLVMFGSLAALFVVTWHRGAVLRVLLRSLLGSPAGTSSPHAAQEIAARRRVALEPDQQVRVHTSELHDEELVARTEVQTVDRGSGPPARAERMP